MVTMEHRFEFMIHAGEIFERIYHLRVPSGMQASEKWEGMTRRERMATWNRNRKTLKALEDDLLYRLANSTGNLLDDVELIEVKAGALAANIQRGLHSVGNWAARIVAHCIRHLATQALKLVPEGFTNSAAPIIIRHHHRHLTLAILISTARCLPGFIFCR